MVKRPFLLPIAVVLSALSQSSNANLPKADLVRAAGDDSNQPPSADAGLSDSILGDVQPGERKEILLKGGDDLFGFVLHKSISGVLMATHRSHYSHESHASHRSHYSSR